MMNYELITVTVLFAFASSITPGPNNIMLLASGINFGFRRTIPHMLGISIGFGIMVILLGLGLIQVFDTFPLTYQILKVISVAYLLYLAYKIATATPIERESEPTNDSQPAKPFSFIQAALFQWVNPKAWTMALTAITAYTPPDRPFSSILLMAAIFSIVNLPSVSIWTMLGSQLRRFLGDPIKLRIFNITAALLLIASLYPVFF